MRTAFLAALACAVSVAYANPPADTAVAQVRPPPTRLSYPFLLGGVVSPVYREPYPGVGGIVFRAWPSQRFGADLVASATQSTVARTDWGSSGPDVFRRYEHTHIRVEADWQCRIAGPTWLFGTCYAGLALDYRRSTGTKYTVGIHIDSSGSQTDTLLTSAIGTRDLHVGVGAGLGFEIHAWRFAFIGQGGVVVPIVGYVVLTYRAGICYRFGRPR